MSLKERRIETETNEQMTPNEFRRYVIEPVNKVLSKNSIPIKTSLKAARRARYSEAQKKMKRYDT